MKIISTKQGNRHYLITVVNGQPYYCSFDQRSSSYGTWLFFGGVLEKSHRSHPPGWFIQPKLPQKKDNVTNLFGNSTWQFIESHGISKHFPIHSFGDIFKMCVSASLGGGFWRTSKGMLLKQHLQMKYPTYLLDTKQISKFKKTYGKPYSFKTLGHEINKWLNKQGVSYAGVTLSISQLVENAAPVNVDSHARIDNNSIPDKNDISTSYCAKT